MTKSYYYFLAPTFDYPPDGQIILGNVITHPSAPEDPINVALPPTIPNVTEVTKGHWRSDSGTHRSASGGIFAQFLQLVGIGGDMSLKQHRTSSLSYEVDSMITRHFRPSLPYVQESLREESVRDYLVLNNFREPMYMITGVMIARGAGVTEMQEKGHGGSANFGIDATAAGVPLTVGPKLNLSATGSQCVSYRIPEAFVFAFRVSKLRVKKRGGVKVADYIKGAVYSAQKDVRKQGPDDEFEVMDVEEEETASEEFGLRSVDVGEEDGTIYHCYLSDAA